MRDRYDVVMCVVYSKRLCYLCVLLCCPFNNTIHHCHSTFYSIPSLCITLYSIALYYISIVLYCIVFKVKWLNEVRLSSKESASHWQQRDYKLFSPSSHWAALDWSVAPAIQVHSVV